MIQKNVTENHKKQPFFVKIEKEKKITFLYILNKNERRNMRKLALNDEILLKIEKPARYIGNEVNSVMKDKNEVDVRFAMCFPDVSEAL